MTGSVAIPVIKITSYKQLNNYLQLFKPHQYFAILADLSPMHDRLRLCTLETGLLPRTRVQNITLKILQDAPVKNSLVL